MRDPKTLKFNVNPRELAFALMEKDARENGTQYYKCANCGGIYVLGKMGDSEAEDWQDRTVCSPRCFDDYVSYLNNPEGF